MRQKLLAAGESKKVAATLVAENDASATNDDETKVAGAEVDENQMERAGTIVAASNEGLRLRQPLSAPSVVAMITTNRGEGRGGSGSVGTHTLTQSLPLRAPASVSGVGAGDEGRQVSWAPTISAEASAAGNENIVRGLRPPQHLQRPRSGGQAERRLQQRRSGTQNGTSGINIDSGGVWEGDSDGSTGLEGVDNCDGRAQ